VAVVDPATFETIYLPVGPQDVRLLVEKQERVDAELAAQAARRLENIGRTVEHDVLNGRPSSVLAAEAVAMGADLIVVGSRGRGGIATTLLGSVSAETVDQATVPVLVARTRTISRVLLAVDGSETADHVLEWLATTPLFASLRVDVVNVAPRRDVWDLLGEANLGAYADHDRFDADIRAYRGEVAEAAVQRLRRAGHPAEWIVPVGDPGEEIVKIAAEQRSDVILMGTHGFTGLERVILGSVARRVLTHAPCSVLVVPPAQRD
jgi:nucleotide-binding universal stress UspA family protein